MNIAKFNYINYPKKNVKKSHTTTLVIVNQSQQFQNKASHIYIKSLPERMTKNSIQQLLNHGSSKTHFANYL